MMAERVPIDTYCEKKIPTLQKTYDGLIDYVDISSVDNTEKKIISYQTIESNGAPSRAKQLLKKGDVLVSTVRPNLNAVAVVEEETENLMVGSTGYCVLRCKDNMDVRYLFNFCQSQYFVDDMSSQATGASYPAVSNGIVRSALIPCYSIEEQREIAEKIDTVSELLVLRKQQLAELDELIKSRFIELFGDPESNPYKWSISKLSEFCDLQNGYAFKSQDYLDDSSVLNCRMSNIRPDGGFDAEYHPKYLPDIFWEKYREYRLVDGDVIIAMTDMASDPKILGVPTIVRTNGKKFLLNQRVGKLTFYDIKTINNIYLMFVLSQKHIRQQLVKSAGGSTQINVGKPAVLGVEFFVPPMELQEQFAAFVEQTNKSKLAVQQSIVELEELKKSLMQKYFG